MPFGLGIGEAVLLALVILLLTGGRDLPRMGAELGARVRELTPGRVLAEAGRRALSRARSLFTRRLR